MSVPRKSSGRRRLRLPSRRLRKISITVPPVLRRRHSSYLHAYRRVRLRYRRVPISNRRWSNCPIAFLSKARNTQRIRVWSTPEKESYAIFYALGKIDYLLCDTKFTLRTDHKNLTLPFLNNEQNAQVRRWKLAIQQYDFDIEFINGEVNIIADGFSRLVPFTVDTLNSLVEMVVPREKQQLIQGVHNTTAGHVGVDRTMERLLRNNDPWPHMREHVKIFIKKCPCCQKQSVLNVKAYTRPFTTARYEPMECLNIDTIGPLEANVHYRWQNRRTEPVPHGQWTAIQE